METHQIKKSEAPQHSPLPWTVTDEGLINDATGRELRGNPVNQQFAVRCVNNAEKLAEALEGLFRECVMVHKHWGENSNQSEADAAVTRAQSALKDWQKGAQQ